MVNTLAKMSPVKKSSNCLANCLEYTSVPTSMPELEEEQTLSLEQRLVSWLDSQEANSLVTRDAICSAVNLTHEQFKNLMRKSHLQVWSRLRKVEKQKSVYQIKRCNPPII